MAKGVISVNQAKHLDSMGEGVRSLGTAGIAQGLINTSSEVTEMLKEDMKTKEPKIFIKSGKKVLLYVY